MNSLEKRLKKLKRFEKNLDSYFSEYSSQQVEAFTEEGRKLVKEGYIIYNKSSDGPAYLADGVPDIFEKALAYDRELIKAEIKKLENQIAIQKQ